MSNIVINFNVNVTTTCNNIEYMHTSSLLWLTFVLTIIILMS